MTRAGATAFSSTSQIVVVLLATPTSTCTLLFYWIHHLDSPYSVQASQFCINLSSSILETSNTASNHTAAMSVVSLLGVKILNNPAAFTDSYQFEITFECLESLKQGMITLHHYRTTNAALTIPRLGVETHLCRICHFCRT
jgi:ASF1 like histone chaperone